MKIKKSILVVGGTGFIGYHFGKKCLKKNFNVESLSTTKPKKKRFLKNINYIICDITKKKLLKKKLKKKYDYIVNLGGHVNHSNKSKTYKSHYIGVKNLTNHFLEKPPKLFLQFGSGGEYGNIKSPHLEIVKYQKLENYYKAKFLATTYLLKLFKTKNFPVSIFRLYQAYGPKQDNNRLIPYIIESCLNNKNFDCTHGKQLRDFIYVDDVVNAMFKALRTKNAVGQIFNIGTGKPISVKYLINYIKTIIGRGKPQFNKIKLRKDEKMKTYPNIKKIKTYLKWKPKVTFFRGIKKTIINFKFEN